MLVYPASATERLGFDTILRQVDSFLVSQMGREALAAETPSSDTDLLIERARTAAEIRDAIRFDDPLPWSELPDIRSYLKAVRPEGSLLDPPALLEIRHFAVAARNIRSYFNERPDKYPLSAAVVSPIADLKDIEDIVRKTIDADGQILDGASPNLQRIRRSIASKERELRDSLASELRKAVASGYATEEQPTIRSGRMVIPVRAEAKRKVRGFVHDASATGQTVYVEPEACLELNNELRELQSAEKAEERRILIAIADQIRGRRPEFADASKTMATFDVLQAKARLAVLLEGVVPQVGRGRSLRIRAGRNPALALHFTRAEETGEKREVVPLDLDIDDDTRTLLITGPNAGGKTVALGAVGLFAVMIAYGMPVPCDESSEFPRFDRLLVDIGDEQSLENDLSTFSSHVRNLVRMISEAGEGSLVLIDEAGTGTDPEEGGALAQAVLERLNQTGALTIATTHHGSLKAFAHASPGVRNGSMEFDRERLTPTFRFRLDVAGSSYAFDIGRRMGLSGDILERARELLGEGKANLEELIADYEKKVLELDRQLSAAAGEKGRAERARSKFEREMERLSREKSDLRRESIREAERLVAEANARIERTIREIKESEADRRATRKAREQLEAFRGRLQQEIAAEEEPIMETAPGDLGPSPLAVGDQVVLDDGSTAAEILELDNDHAVIANNAMRLRVERSRLTKVGSRRPQKVEVRHLSSGQPVLSTSVVRQRIDVRGLRADEALAEVRSFVDAAVPTSLDRLEIVHGKGTGALKVAIHDYLSTRPDVRSFEEADIQQGGAGVTIVRLG